MHENEVRYVHLGDSLLLKAFGSSPKLRIIDIFLTNPMFDFSKNELVRELGMSKQTLYKCFNDLEELGIVKVTRKIGRANLYRLNPENPMVKMLNEQTTQLSLQIAEKEKARIKSAVSRTMTSASSRRKIKLRTSPIKRIEFL